MIKHESSVGLLCSMVASADTGIKYTMSPCSICSHEYRPYHSVPCLHAMHYPSTNRLIEHSVYLLLSILVESLHRKHASSTEFWPLVPRFLSDLQPSKKFQQASHHSYFYLFSIENLCVRARQANPTLKM